MIEISNNSFREKTLKRHHKRIIYLIYLYYFFIIYDAIFRKWLIPSLSAPIMMIKQIIAILIFFFGIKYLIRQESISWEKLSIVVGLIVFLISLIWGHGNILVAFWGCLPYWFGIPVCFIIGKVLQQKDLINIGKITVYTSIINSLLIIIQFYLPTGHWLNYKGWVIGENISSLTTVDLAGMFRPCGIFITSSHNSLFMLFALSFILYFFFIKKSIISSKVLIISLILFVISCVCTTSRTNIFYSLGFLFFFFIFYAKRNTFRKVFSMVFLFMILFYLFSITSIGEKSLNNIGRRFENASEVQYQNKSTFMGTIYDIYTRTIAYNMNALINPQTIDGNSIPFWGYGQGMSTQVGGRLLNVKMGKSGFTLAEWDGLRIMCESGYFFGWLIIFMRLSYIFRFIPDLFSLKRKNRFLSIIIYPTFFLSFFLLNTWGNSFLGNFAFFAGGLFLASLKDSSVQY